MPEQQDTQPGTDSLKRGVTDVVATAADVATIGTTIVVLGKSVVDKVTAPNDPPPAPPAPPPEQPPVEQPPDVDTSP
jgi:hypothetical protein